MQNNTPGKSLIPTEHVGSVPARLRLGWETSSTPSPSWSNTNAGPDPDSAVGLRRSRRPRGSASAALTAATDDGEHGLPVKYPFVCSTPGCDKRYRYAKNLESHKMLKACREEYDYTPLYIPGPPVGPPEPEEIEKATRSSARLSLRSPPLTPDDSPALGELSPFTCDAEGCKEVFSTSRELRRHRTYGTCAVASGASQSNTKPFVCVCDKRYAYKESVYNHVKSGKCPGALPKEPSPHDSEPSSPVLQRMTEHTGVALNYDTQPTPDDPSRPYACACGKRYAHRTSLWNHRKRSACPSLSETSSNASTSKATITHVGGSRVTIATAPPSPPPSELSAESAEPSPKAKRRRKNAAAEPDPEPRTFVCLVPGCGKAYKNKKTLSTHFSAVGHRDPDHRTLGRQLRDIAAKQSA